LDHTTFQAILANTLEPQSQKVIGKYPGLILKNDWETRVEEQYEEARRIIRTEMRRLNQPDDELRIDRHKVGAAIAMAILRALPFTYTGLLVGGRLANEDFSFRAAIGVVVSFGYTEAKKADDKELMRRYKTPFLFPPSSDGPYREHILKVFYLLRQGQTINLFLLSNLLFVLEQFHLATTSTLSHT
jgi:hypothetical protein